VGIGIEEDVVWLDGYLKGVALFSGGTSNAVLVDLVSSSVMQSYMDFINMNDDAELLGIEFPVLRLTTYELVNSWEDEVANNIRRSFSDGEKYLFQSATSQVLDILDGIFSEVEEKVVSTCIAKIGRAFGICMFFHLSGDQYLVLSFLRDEVA